LPLLNIMNYSPVYDDYKCASYIISLVAAN
jgi:hypothetical protein